MANTLEAQVGELASLQHRLEVICAGLCALIAKPLGNLTREEVVASGAAMVADGAFPGAGGNAVVTLSELPASESCLRAFIGLHLMNYAAAHEAIKAQICNRMLGPECGSLSGERGRGYN